MARYRKNEAREWAREHLRGVANVVIPSYTGDLKGLNEKGIRHDIRKEIEYGFAGTLLVSEVNVTLDEYRQFFEWSNDEARGPADADPPRELQHAGGEHRGGADRRSRTAAS